MTTLIRRYGVGYCLGYVVTLATTAGVAAALWSVGLSLIDLRPRMPEVLIVTAAVSGSGLSETYMTTEAGLATLCEQTRSVFESCTGQVASAGLQAEYRVKLSSPIDGGPLQVTAVADNFFEVLGVVIVGRHFGPTDGEAPGTLPVVVSKRLGEALGRVGGVGAQIKLGSQLGEVVGVVPTDFSGVRRGEETEVWIPARSVRWLTAGRSRGPGPLIPIVRKRRSASAREIATALSNARPNVRLEAVPARQIFGSAESPSAPINRQRLTRLIGISLAGVLLAGTVPIVAVQALHVRRRWRDDSVRAILGATRRVLMLDALKDHLILAFLSAVPAASVALAIVHFLQSIPSVGHLELSRLLTASSALAYGAALLVSIFMAVAATMATYWGSAGRPRLTNPVPAPTGVLRTPGWTMILAAHAASTTLLLGVAGILMTGVNSATNKVGRSYDGLAFFEFQVRSATRRANEDAIDHDVAAALRNALSEVQRIGGLDVVGLGPRPLGPYRLRQLDRPRTVRTPSGLAVLRLAILPADASYLRAIGADLLSGSVYSVVDGEVGRREVVINEEFSLATGVKPGETVEVDGFGERWVVVGVVRVPPIGSARVHTPVLFMPTDIIGEARDTVVHLVTRAKTPEMNATVVRQVEQVVATHVPDLIAASRVTGEDLIRHELALDTVVMAYFSCYGLLSLLLSVFTTAWICSYTCLSRAHECGVRLAIGAGPSLVVWLLARRLLIPTIAGAMLGGATCLAIVDPLLRVLGGAAAGATPIAVGVGVGCSVVAAAVTVRIVSRFVSAINPSELIRAMP